MYCPRCGKEITTSGAFCGFCGARLPGRSPSASAAKPAPKPQAPETAKPARDRRRVWLYGGLAGLAVVLIVLAALLLPKLASRSPAAEPDPAAAPPQESSAPAAVPAATAAPAASAQPPEPTPTPLPEKDPFEALSLEFSGVEGQGTARIIWPGEAQPEDYSLTPETGLRDGDTVTLRFLRGEALGFRPTRTELAFTVEGLAQYAKRLGELSSAAAAVLENDAKTRLQGDAALLGMTLRPAEDGNALSVVCCQFGDDPLDGPQYTALWYSSVTATDAPLDYAAFDRAEPFADPYVWYAARAAEGAERTDGLSGWSKGDGLVRQLSDLSAAGRDALRAAACESVAAALSGSYTVLGTTALGECFVRDPDEEKPPEEAGVVAVVVQARVRNASGKEQSLCVPAAYTLLFSTPEGVRCGWAVGAVEQEGALVSFPDLKSLYRTARVTLGFLYDIEIGSELQALLN